MSHPSPGQPPLPIQAHAETSGAVFPVPGKRVIPSGNAALARLPDQRSMSIRANTTNIADQRLELPGIKVVRLKK